MEGADLLQDLNGLIEAQMKENREGWTEVMMIVLPEGDGYTFYPLLYTYTHTHTEHRRRDNLPIDPRGPEATWTQYPLLQLSQLSVHEGGYWPGISQPSGVMNPASADSSRLTHRREKDEKLEVFRDGTAPKLAFDGD